jgi:hypothetical protein
VAVHVSQLWFPLIMAPLTSVILLRNRREAKRGLPARPGPQWLWMVLFVWTAGVVLLAAVALALGKATLAP